MMGMTQQRLESARAKHSLSTDVIYAIAEHEGVDPLRLHPPLFEAIDLDALDALFSGAEASPAATVTFSYKGYEVRVSNSGAVDVSGPGNA